ncbi:YciI family protein [Rhodovibrionaceae bacterium A322]
MFVVLLRFSSNKAQAGQFMEGHNAWLKSGFDAGVFLLAGSLQPKLGGAILAHGLSKEELEVRVSEDPFVAEEVVSAEILEISPGKADERLAFLMAE